MLKRTALEFIFSVVYLIQC